jgi:hypothetical protein
VIATTNVVFGTTCPKAPKVQAGLLPDTAKEVFLPAVLSHAGGATDTGSTICRHVCRCFRPGFRSFGHSAQLARHFRDGPLLLYSGSVPGCCTCQFV